MSDWSITESLDMSPLDAFDSNIPPFFDILVGMTRRMTFIRPINSIISKSNVAVLIKVKQTACIVLQKVICKSSEGVCVSISTSTPDVPHGEGFVLNTTVKLTRLASKKTHVMIASEFVWKRGLWLLKGQIESGGYCGLKLSYETLFNAIDNLVIESAELMLKFVDFDADLMNEDMSTCALTIGSIRSPRIINSLGVRNSTLKRQSLIPLLKTSNFNSYFVIGCALGLIFIVSLINTGLLLGVNLAIKKIDRTQ